MRPVRTITLRGGRWCLLHGTGIRGDTPDDALAEAGSPEVVEYTLHDVSGRCVLPGDWATRTPDDLGALVEDACRYTLAGAVAPFDGQNGRAIRDLVIRAARMPFARLRELAALSATRHAEQRSVTWLLNGNPGRAYEARRLPRYLEAAAGVVLADAADPQGDGPSPADVAAAIGPAATALLVCDPPGRHDHSSLAVAYRALVTPFQT
jgi:hypothetical protein